MEVVMVVDVTEEVCMSTTLEGISLEALRDATAAYVVRRTKKWLGACWHKPSTTLCLEWDDEMCCQVGELLRCSPQEAEWILKLLQVAGAHIVFASHVYDRRMSVEEEDDDEEEFDEDGWLIGKAPRRLIQSRFQDRFVGQHRRFLGLLSGRGLRLQTQVIFYDGINQVFFPSVEVPIMADYAVTMAQRYEGKGVRQIRFVLNLQLFYVMSFCAKE